MRLLPWRAGSHAVAGDAPVERSDAEARPFAGLFDSTARNAERRNGTASREINERGADDSFALAAFVLSRSAHWLPCRVYVPADAPRRVITAIVVEANEHGASILAPSDLRQDDEQVAVTFQLASGEGRLIACHIASRSAVHTEATLLDLRFDALSVQDEAFVRSFAAELRKSGSSGAALTDAA